jgi:3'-phosphoadenosine 5'-phosphosulfate (PAPS) 3'-phosphatase
MGSSLKFCLVAEGKAVLFARPANVEWTRPQRKELWKRLAAGLLIDGKPLITKPE